MKYKLIIAAACLTLMSITAVYAEDSSTGSTSANAGKPTPGQIERRGERIEQHMDKRGDRIERRMDAKAAKARAAGNTAKAERLEKRGDKINRHLDKKGERIERRHEIRAHGGK